MTALRDLVEQVRQQAQVPGCAVVVVRDGEVLLCEGFGERDIATNLPVTSSTLFPIGSATKTFTAALVTRLALEGLFDLDAPLRSYRPDLTMLDPLAAAALSFRDCLSHRSGLPRHDLVWLGAGDDIDRNVLITRIGHLPSSEPFRSAYQYNNLLYIVAGHVAAGLAGGSYEDLVRRTLLDPLGMHRATFLSDQARGDADHAKPYQLTDAGVAPISFVPLDFAGPAGSLNASATDLVPWLLALTAPDPALTQMRQPCIDRLVPEPHGPFGGASYGLGLMLETYRGHAISHHGGNIDGYSSQVLTRDDGVGVAVLTNLHATSMRDSLAYQVLDLLDGVDPSDHPAFFAARLQTSLAPLRARSARAPATGTGDLLLTGHYCHPGYGEVSVDRSGEGLGWSYEGHPQGPLVVGAGDGVTGHYRVTAHYRFFGVDLVAAGTAAPDRLELQLEPSTGPIVFARC